MIIEGSIPVNVRSMMLESGVRGSKRFTMGECNILLGRDPAGPGEAYLWHMSISSPDRHPTWDEIKTARYRLLPSELTFAMILPPPDLYFNLPEQDHVFHLWEIEDSREVH